MKGAQGDYVGLCRRCAHHRKVRNRRGTSFYLCRRWAEDPTFPRYPRLPVVACRGFEEEGPERYSEIPEGEEEA